MKSLKVLLTLLLAWTFTVPAVAGVSGMGCRHDGKAAVTMTDDASHAGHASGAEAPDPHAMHHAAGHTEADGGKEPASSWLGCGCGCLCVSQHCANPASGLIGQAGTGIAALAALSLRPGREQANPARAHDHDLIRPPSIS